jgi:hypothetical protein
MQQASHLSPSGWNFLALVWDGCEIHGLPMNAVQRQAPSARSPCADSGSGLFQLLRRQAAKEGAFLGIKIGKLFIKT